MMSGDVRFMSIPKNQRLRLRLQMSRQGQAAAETAQAHLNPRAVRTARTAREVHSPRAAVSVRANGGRGSLIRLRV